jgi:hypothetical protein
VKAAFFFLFLPFYWVMAHYAVHVGLYERTRQ